MQPFLRFPGGKSKHVPKISRYFKDQEKEYREPFVGGGSVYLGGYHFADAWINDIDPELYDLWRMVKETPKVLIDLIEEHTNVLDHRRQKRKIKQAISLWQSVKADIHHKLYPAGYRFLFLSKTCFSGIITAGPTGGMSQTGNYNLMSRWCKKQTVKRIRLAHECLQDCRITLGNWEKLVEEPGKDVALYLDPPYLKKGRQLYRYYFELKDHQRLADFVYDCPHRWVVTVDNTPSIVEIWKKRGIPEHRLIEKFWMYSADGTRTENRLGKELFIMDEESFEIAKQRDMLCEH